MTQMPTELDTEQGYAPPKVVQFSVFLDNRVGRLLNLLEIFEGRQLTLAGVSILESTGHAVVRVLTSSAELGRRLLYQCEYPFSETDVICVELGNGHSLLSVCECLLEAELNLHYAYPLLVRPRGRAVVAVSCDDIVLAGQLLRRRHFELLAENDLGDNASHSTPGTPNNPEG